MVWMCSDNFGLRRACAELICHPVCDFLESELFSRLLPGIENAPAHQIVPTGLYWTVLRSSIHLRQPGMLVWIVLLCALYVY